MDRRRMMAKKARLPSEYQEVEWLRSDGNQLIDLNTIPTELFGCKTKVYDEYTKFDAYGNVYDAGTYGSSNSTFYNFSHRIKTSEKYRMFHSHRVSSDRGYSFTGLNYLNDIEISIINSRAVVNNYTHSFTKPIYSADTSLKLLSGWIGRMYYFKYFEGETIMKDLVPCYSKSDGVIGMYDLCGSICPLTNTPFYINAGTGSFTKGADVK